MTPRKRFTGWDGAVKTACIAWAAVRRNRCGNMVDPALPLGLGERPYAENQVMCLCADITALTADTGFVPKVPFSEGIARTVEWMKNHPAGA